MTEAASRVLTYSIALVVFLFDRLSKVIIESRMPAFDSYTVVPGFFDIIRTENRGAAFSLFAAAESEWRSFFLVGVSAAALLLVAYLLWKPSAGRLGGSQLVRLGLAFILGGALGNLYDRVVHGAVTDFLDFYVGGFHWPAFNVADSAITIGAALVVWDMLRSRSPADRT